MKKINQLDFQVLTIFNDKYNMTFIVQQDLDNPN